MNEKKLTKISIFGATISILTLYLITSNIVSSQVNIGDIDKSFVGKTINITGEITSIANNKGNVFISIKDETGEIRAVLWEDTIKSINDIDMSRLDEGSKVNIIGDVQIYKGEIEIIPIRGSLRII